MSSTIYFDMSATYYNTEVATEGIELDDNKYIHGTGPGATSMGLDANVYLTG